MDKKYLSMGILVIIGFVVLVSGCTSSESQNSTQGYQKDIELTAASYDYFAEDGSASGGVDVYNAGQVTYKKVKIQLEVFDENGNSLGNFTRTVGVIKPGEEINWFVITEKALPKGKSASAAVLNATPV